MTKLQSQNSAQASNENITIVDGAGGLELAVKLGRLYKSASRKLTSGSMFIEGRLAHIVYISLYRMHQVVIYGKFKTLLFMFVSNKR